jgi:hypothetical protein
MTRRHILAESQSIVSGFWVGSEKGRGWRGQAAPLPEVEQRVPRGAATRRAPLSAASAARALLQRLCRRVSAWTRRRRRARCPVHLKAGAGPRLLPPLRHFPAIRTRTREPHSARLQRFLAESAAPLKVVDCL